MGFDIVNHRETDNIVPIELANKGQYYNDLIDLERSWTGMCKLQTKSDPLGGEL
jgi:hypothetical protein